MQASSSLVRAPAGRKALQEFRLSALAGSSYIGSLVKGGSIPVPSYSIMLSDACQRAISKQYWQMLPELVRTTLERALNDTRERSCLHSEMQRSGLLQVGMICGLPRLEGTPYRSRLETQYAWLSRQYTQLPYYEEQVRSQTLSEMLTSQLESMLREEIYRAVRLGDRRDGSSSMT